MNFSDENNHSCFQSDNLRIIAMKVQIYYNCKLFLRKYYLTDTDIYYLVLTEQDKPACFGTVKEI